MASPYLANYLRAHRKRSGLSQQEVAYLLGWQSGSRVCRHEGRKQHPNLRTLLAYEILFQTPMRNLFSGVGWEVEEQILERAQLLLEKLARDRRDKRNSRKIETLLAILGKRSSGKRLR